MASHGGVAARAFKEGAAAQVLGLLGEAKVQCGGEPSAPIYCDVGWKCCKNEAKKLYTCQAPDGICCDGMAGTKGSFCCGHRGHKTNISCPPFPNDPLKSVAWCCHSLG